MASQDAATAGGDPLVPSPTPQPIPSRALQGTKTQTSILVLGLAILAGVAAWLLGEITFNYFKPSEAAASQSRSFAALNREKARTNALNAAVAFGALGGLLGLALGVAGGLARRSAEGALMSAVAGLILGTAAGALPPFVVMPWQWRHRHDDPASVELIVPIGVHLALWSAAGLAAGLAFGIGSTPTQPGRIAVSALSGLVGAILGTIIFDLIGAFLFPLDRTVDAFSKTPGTRLLARICVAGLVGLGAVRSVGFAPAKEGPGPP